LPRDQVSMQSIRSWLAAHPGDAAGLMNENPSYVFFRELHGEGPLGAEGVVLTPGRSLAVDRSFLALGVPLWLDAADPAAPGGRLRRLVVAQDTGGAIRGPVRGDVFWGYGTAAADRAGKMKDRGFYYLLLPLEVAARRNAQS
jgi:membrane-bound lytic murein transglycosylase A